MTVTRIKPSSINSPFRAWRVRIYTKMGKVVYIPLPANDIDLNTGERIEGVQCECRELAEENGYKIGKILPSTYIRLNRDPDLESIAKRIIPFDLNGEALDKFVADRLSELEDGAGI